MLSTTKAEYMALTHAAQEGLYLQQLQVEPRIDNEGMGLLLFCVNNSSTRIVPNLVFHKRCYDATSRMRHSLRISKHTNTQVLNGEEKHYVKGVYMNC